VIARLQAYYGGDPMTWLRVPTGILHAYVAMLPRLKNEDRMSDAEVIAVGTGTMDKNDRKRVLREWSDAAQGDTRETTKPTAEERVMMMEAVGIHVG